MREWVERMATDRAWVVIVFMVIVSSLAAVGAGNLYFRGDYKVFFEEGYGPLNDFEEMQKIFNKSDSIGVLVVPQGDTVIDEEILTLIQEYTDEAWQTPFSSRVDSLTNYQNTWAEYDDMMVEDMVLYPDALTPEDLVRIRDTALAEPSLNGRIISPSTDVSLINITLQLPDVTDNTANVASVMDFVRDLSAQYAERYPNVAFYHTGIIPMNYSFATEGQKDMMTLVPAMLLLIVVLLAVLLRSVYAMVATVIVLVLTISATMGLAGWMGFFLSTGTINVPIVVLTIAVADCVHVVATMQYGMKQGMNRKEAVRYSLELNWMPIFITSATTAVGFLTLMMSESPVFADFGFLCAMGVMLAYVMSVTLFPALLAVFPVSAGGRVDGKAPAMAHFGDFVIRNQTPLLWGGVVVVAILSALALRNEVNDVATEYFADSTAYRQSVDKQADTLSGSQSIDWAMYVDEAGGISNPEFIAVMHEFTNWLENQPEIDHVSGLSDIFMRLNKNMHGDDPEWYVIPDDRELAAQYLLLYEMSLPYGLDLNNQVNVDKSAVRMTSVLKNLGSVEIVSLENRAKAWMDENGQGIRLTAASPSVMFSHIGETNMRSMMLSMFVALFIISGILIFALRSLRLGIISLFPNVTPALVGFGFWTFISGEINLGLSIVSSMTLGIIVDDSVHFLSKYKRARSEGMSTEEAVRYSFINVGRALLITTLVLMLGFSMLAFSAFRLNSDMGIATSLIILIALIIDFLILPPLLLWLDKDKPAADAAEHSSLKGEHT
ncbi:MAG: MMPL family transporter [Pseudomonadota bacterium]|nr:MMPL family transporter [Pseudomonadota bacterium]